MTLAAIPELYNFTLSYGVEGYATTVADSDSDMASSVATVIFAVAGDSDGKEREKDGSDGGSYNRSRVWQDTIR